MRKISVHPKLKPASIKRKPTMRTNKTNYYTEEKYLDGRYIHLPLIVITSIIAFFMWITWEAVNERNRIDNSIERVKVMVENLTKSMSTILPILQRSLHDGWDSRDHQLWCYQAQEKNPNWKCPEMSSLIMKKSNSNNESVIDERNLQDLLNEQEKQLRN